jgi:hypothetical protein
MDQQRLEFVVKGSKGDEYHILAERVGDRVVFFCTCKNARYDRSGNLCKHRWALLDGIVDNLLSGNEAEAALLPAMLTGTPSEEAWAHYREAARACQTAQDALESAKRALSRTMTVRES